MIPALAAAAKSTKSAAAEINKTIKLMRPAQVLTVPVIISMESNVNVQRKIISAKMGHMVNAEYESGGKTDGKADKTAYGTI